MRRTDAQSAAVPIKISYFNGRVVSHRSAAAHAAPAEPSVPALNRDLVAEPAGGAPAAEAEGGLVPGDLVEAAADFDLRHRVRDGGRLIRTLSDGKSGPALLRRKNARKREKNCAGSSWLPGQFLPTEKPHTPVNSSQTMPAIPRKTQSNH